jgi:ribose-phosphate pyrophosphokinase
VLAGKALERVAGSALTSLVITDSIATTEAVKAAKNIRVISVAPLLAEAIRRISEESSVSSLFD